MEMGYKKALGGKSGTSLLLGTNDAPLNVHNSLIEEIARMITSKGLIDPELCTCEELQEFFICIGNDVKAIY